MAAAIPRLSFPTRLCDKQVGGTRTNHQEHSMKTLISSVLLVLASSAALAQDIAAGKTSFNKCLACHAVGEGAKNKVGPQLNGLNGRKSGTAEGYSYSEANKNSGITWDEATFKDYIKDPKAKIPGTKMVFSRTSRKPAICGRSSRST